MRALLASDKDKALKAALGDAVSQAFLKLKTTEWQSYKAHLSEWEKVNTLDV